MRERNPDYQRVIEGMMSMKTANLATLEEACQYRLEHFDYLFDFCASKPFLKWRFSGFINQHKALTWMAKKVVGKNKSVAVGLGDWSQVVGFVKGRQKAPSKRIEKALGNFATVIKVDEFRTSQVCSRCKVGKLHKDDHKLKKANFYK